MKDVRHCPACGGARHRPFSYTVEAERNGDLHFAQTRCARCDLVFSNPVAEPADLEHFYRSSYYEAHEPDFRPGRVDLEAAVRARARREAEGLRSTVLPYVSGGAFFEIGAGCGSLLLGARDLGFSVAGVEPSEHAARFGREVLGLDGLRQGMFDADRCNPESCDVIYSFHVIEHVSDLHAFIGGIARMLKPGGLGVIGTENHRNVWVDVRRLRSWAKGRRLPEFQTASHHTFYFSDRSLAALLARHGLSIVQSLVYTPSLQEKLPHYAFRSWRSKLAFYLLHYADEWSGRGGRLLVWFTKGAR